METPIRSTISVPLDMDDPWDWDVDHVVQALCYRQNPLLGPSDFTKEFPDPSELEPILRENSVGGFALLTDVNNATMREDLGIKRFGHRCAITHLVRQLRRHSPKWLANHHAMSADNHMPGYGVVSDAVNEHGALSSSRSFLNHGQGFSPYGAFASHPAFGPNLRTQNWVQGQDGQNGESSPHRSSFGQSHLNTLQDASTLPRPDSSTAELLRARAADASNYKDASQADLVLDPMNDRERRGSSEVPGKAITTSEQGVVAGNTLDRRNETSVVDESGRKRRKLILSAAKPVAAKGTKSPHEAEAVTAILTPPEEGPGDELSIEDQSRSTDEMELPITTHDGLQRATTELEDKAGMGRPDKLPKPGVVVLDDKGRKRVRPLLLTQPEDATAVGVEEARMVGKESQHLAANPTPTSPRKSPDDPKVGFAQPNTDKRACNTYSGIKAWPVDEIFYGSTAFGQPILNEVNLPKPTLSDGMVDHPENFLAVSENRFGNGCRLYINARIKHLFRSSQRKVLHRAGKKVHALVPYPDKLARKHQPLSITEFIASSEGYTASRQNRSRLAPDVLDTKANFGQDTALFNVPEDAKKSTNTDAEDPDFLEKWKYQDDEDKVLPLFGDSGSEGEYDLDTWREMEDEQGTLARPPAQSRSISISRDEVKAAITQAIKQIQEGWQLKRLSKLKGKEWTLWMKCTRDGSKQQRIGELVKAITGLEARLLTLQNEIMEESWRSTEQVLKQCKILQPSIYDNEECKWEVLVLRLKRPPEKPQRISKLPKLPKSKQIRGTIGDGEEALASEGSACPSSEDDLGDFIAEDEDAAVGMVKDDGIMADVEHEGPSDAVDANDVIDLDSASCAELSSLAQEQTSRGFSESPKHKSEKKRQTKASLKPQPVCIDLTQASDPVEPENLVAKPEPKSPNKIRTPPLKAQEDSGDEFGGAHRKSSVFRRPPVAPEIIELESDTYDGGQLSLSQSPLPDLQDYPKICRLSVRLLEERQDRKRLLIWTLSKYKASQRQSALKIIRGMSFHNMRLYIWRALATYKGYGWRIRGHDTEFSDSLMLIAAFYVCWTIPVRLDPKGGIRVDHLATAVADREGFDPFYHFLIECLVRFEALSGTKGAIEDLQCDTPIKKHISQLPEDEELSIYATPTKKRKHAVQESQAARELRDQAQGRAQELELRKKALKLRYQKMGLNDEDPSKVVVNPGKEEAQEFIYLNRKIGERIQPHQKDGVQFMWRELTTDPENLQGCLLAHTMGLGKTMQVITVLVTIAEAAKSPDANIRRQIPKPLRASQTLVLCPSSLVENWFEEFLMWAPEPMEDNIGDVRKITTALSPSRRVAEISDWRDKGGVLLIGFDIFKALISNPRERLTKAQHENILDALLERTNLIVADEDHTAKNLKSNLNMAMNRVKSTSRIGLTGSPLANNLDEYYALIDWVAPNYLGDHVQFKAHYAEPIQQGFYKDSTTADYVESRKRLKALITDLEPKVNRADISVLKGKLEPKIEFLIRVPLTKLQMELYQEYVDWMLRVVRQEEPKSALLWAWLGELRLLCNHPKCYMDLLDEKLALRNSEPKPLTVQEPPKKKAKKKKRPAAEDESVASEDESEMLKAAAGGPQVSTSLMERQLAIIGRLAGPISSVKQAYKMQILDQILVLAKEANDRTLIFSHSIKTLDYLEKRFRKRDEDYSRIDGGVLTGLRQSMTKDFNTGSATVCLVSTRAGGQGLNLFGANRVIILDTSFNPIWEEQAVGRAYRLGQKKPVYVYRLTVGGTFEEALLNQSVFKQQLATRVVDKKNPMRYATRGAKQYLFQPKDLEQQGLDSFLGKDPLVLDRLLHRYQE